MSALAFRGRGVGAAGLTHALAAVLVGLFAAGATVALIHVDLLKAVAVLIMGGGLIWFASTRHPQLALALIMLYLGLLDGYLKLATGSNLVTFVRDVLLYALACGLLIRAVVGRTPLKAPPLSGWLALFAVLVLVQLLNPNNGSLMHSLAGVRQNLEFLPLFWLTYAFVRTKRALRAVVALLALVAVANGVVTVVQSRETPAQLAGWGKGYAERVDGTGAFSQAGRTYYTATGQEFTRPFGLMSDAGSGGLVCAYALGCIIALATMPGRRRFVLPIIGGAILVAGMITAQGRSVIIGGAVVMSVYALMTGSSRFRGRFLPLLMAVFAAAAAYLGVTQFLVSKGSRDTTINASQILQTTEQQRGVAINQIPWNVAHYPFGSGLGSGGPALSVAGAPPIFQTTGVNAETEISLATLDTGIPGMLTIVGFTLALLALGVSRVPREPDPQTRALLSALIAPLGAIFVLYWVSPLLATTPTGPYLYAVGGVVSYWLITRPRELRATQPVAAPLGGNPLGGGALVPG